MAQIKHKMQKQDSHGQGSDLCILRGLRRYVNWFNKLTPNPNKNQREGVVTEVHGEIDLPLLLRIYRIAEVLGRRLKVSCRLQPLILVTGQMALTRVADQSVKQIGRSSSLENTQLGEKNVNFGFFPHSCLRTEHAHCPPQKVWNAEEVERGRKERKAEGGEIGGQHLACRRISSQECIVQTHCSSLHPDLCSGTGVGNLKCSRDLSRRPLGADMPNGASLTPHF